MLRFVPSPFRPAWWLPGPHGQTLGARWLRARTRLPLRRERVELPDGDFLDLDFACADKEADRAASTAIVLVLHGLEGSARSGYALEAYRVLAARGLAAVGLNFRGCSGEPNRLPRFYHSGETGDLRFVLELLARRWPARPRGVIGFSLGGNVLLKYLGECGLEARRHVTAAVAVSVPFDLAAGAAHLLRPSGRIYGAHLLRSLKRKVLAKRALLPAGVDVRRVLAACGLREFDDAATAPLHGFAGAEDYYRRSSSTYYLGGIRVPTLVLHSCDDPFLPGCREPRAAAEDNPWILPGFTARGGHVGFVAGRSLLRPRFWAEAEAGSFLAQLLEPRLTPERSD